MFKDIPSIPVFLVGAGNVSWHLGVALKMTGVNLTHVWSRNLENAKALSEKLSLKPTDNIEDIFHFEGILLFCVPDHIISFFAKKIRNTNAIIIHTSGSVNINVFEKHATQLGVFYPLQTFNKLKLDKDFKDIPVLVESSTLLVEQILNNWASLIGSKVYKVNSLHRMKIHVAAVFACNYINHMASIAKQILAENNLDYELLKPLIKETLSNILTFDPKEIQTGPSVRKDMDTIEKHINILNSHPDFADAYRSVSDSIIKMHYKEEYE